jgi:hypothetical protein
MELEKGAHLVGDVVLERIRSIRDPRKTGQVDGEQRTNGVGDAVMRTSVTRSTWNCANRVAPRKAVIGTRRATPRSATGRPGFRVNPKKSSTSVVTAARSAASAASRLPT